jgi:esterase/lipase superfamily enzyme/HEAT repeat protein
LFRNIFNAKLTLLAVLFAVLIANGPQSSAQEATQATALLARLTRQLTSAVPTQKVQAAGQLAKLGQAASSATELLIACLEDTDPDVRLYAAYALGEVATDLPRALKSLVPVLTDKNEHVRYSAEWSIAKIARRIENLQVSGIKRRGSIIASLEATLNRLAKQDHQPRHAQAVRAALEVLAQAGELAGDDATSTKIPAAVPDNATATAVDRLKKQFAVADRVQTLLLIESVRANYLNQPEILLEATYSVLARNDYYLVEFATHCWGESGRAAMKKVLMRLVDDQLPAWTQILLSNVVPNDRQVFERVLGIAINHRLAIEFRIAALQSVGKTTVDRTRAQAALLAIVLDRAELEDSRLEAELALATLGELPANAFAPLLAIIDLPDESQSLRESLIYHLHTFAPNSVDAVQTLTNQLSSRKNSEAVVVDLANSIANYGAQGSVALRPLMAGLNSKEEFVRVACAKAIGELGEAAVPATGPLVAIIIDPQVTISTKSEVALVLKKIGSRGAAVLTEKLSHEDPVMREHILRALAIIGPVGKAAFQDCLETFINPREDSSVRSAAATALGAFGSASQVAVPQLEVATQIQEDPNLRVAALLALAQIQPTAAAPRIAAMATESSRELRVSAAFAKHLTGLTVESFHDLLGLSEYSNNQIIEETLVDLGPVVMPMLLNTIRDPRATDEQRVTCMRVASQMHPSDWTPMIDLLAHERLGQQFFESILGGWDFDENLLPQLMVALQNEQIPTGGRARMLQLADYITSDLGAGDDYEEWEGSFAISRLVAESQLNAVERESGEEMAMAPTALPHKSQALPEAAAQPYIEEPLQIPDLQKTPTASPLAAVDERLVRVFYGTNRQPTSVVKSSQGEQKSSPGYGAAMGLAIAAMATCCFGFLRRKSPKYTFAAVTGLAACTTLAVQTIRFTDSPVTTIENVEYGGQLSETVEMGVCEVTIPESHRTGELESPSLLLRLEITPDPTKHIVLKSVQRLDPDSFFDDIQEELAQKGSNLLVFVHGYNVSFEEAARRTAQMAFDLKFPGAPVFYSWPSQANWYGYRHDTENIRNSVEQIKSFLTEIAAKSNAASINLVAHSMGNVGLTSALLKMDDGTRFNQIVLAAPDIDAETFKQDIAPKIVPMGNRVTLYTSKTDLALIASKYFNRGPRAGDSGSELLLVPGVQTIDATAVDSSLLGHSYYGSNVNVLHDLGQLLDGKPIEARDYLRPNSDVTRPYWYFAPQQTAIRPPVPIVPLRR